MTEEKKNINLGFRATLSRQEELKILSAKRRQSVQEMLEAGLGLLLQEEQEPVTETERIMRSMAKDNRWHAKLDSILERGDDRHRSVIKGVLEALVQIGEMEADDPEGVAPSLLEAYYSGDPHLKKQLAQILKGLPKKSAFGSVNADEKAAQQGPRRRTAGRVS